MLQTFSEHWTHVVATYPPNWIELTIVFGAQVLGYWLPSALFLALDLGLPTWSNKHKLQSERRQPSLKSILHCLRYVSLSFAVQTGIQLLMQTTFVFNKSGEFRVQMKSNPVPFRVESELPSLAEFGTHFIFGILAREVLFYAAHRILHHPSLYPYVHKKHHLFTAPMALAAQYAHPVEQILANAMPIFLPMAHILPLVDRRCHILTFAAFLVYELLQTTTSHSGYECFWNARMHDLHHEKFGVNYGTIGIVDWAFGTAGAQQAKVKEL